jgi:hypothetical protein
MAYKSCELKLRAPPPTLCRWGDDWQLRQRLPVWLRFFLGAFRPAGPESTKEKTQVLAKTRVVAANHCPIDTGSVGTSAARVISNARHVPVTSRAAGVLSDAVSRRRAGCRDSKVHAARRYGPNDAPGGSTASRSDRRGSQDTRQGRSPAIGSCSVCVASTL